MNRLRTLLVVCMSIMVSHAFAQEVCNNGIDDDGDGFIDCFDPNCSANSVCDDFYLGNDACTAKPDSLPAFTMELDFASPNETTNHLSRIAIGDLDRDGVPEVITMNRYTNRLFVLNGSNGTIKVSKTVTFTPGWEVAIANIDNDNCAEIFFFGIDNRIYAFDCNLNALWTSPMLLGDPINYGLADFDGDGRVELYVKDEIYDAHTGTRIIRTSATKNDNSKDDNNWKNINGGPVAVDITGDSKLELVVGCIIYSVNLGTRTTDSGTLTEVARVPDYHIRMEYNATSVADYNQDGFLDVIASGSTIDHKENTTVFFWDFKNNVIKTFSDPQPAISGYTNGWKNGTGRLNIADLDGDGNLNVSYVSGRFLYALDHNFNLKWRVVINEETSGHTGCTLFDFNADGESEIVYRDEQFIYIIDGDDGSVYNQQACISRTNREYPIVADLDADGSTEICVTCGFDDSDAWTQFNDLTYSRYSHIRVFRSASEPWVPARRLWNQHGYFNVNVNNDLTIPRVQQKHHLVFSPASPCTGGLPNRPLNGFLNQSPFLDSQGCPVYVAPDLSPVAGSLVVNPPTCPDVNYTVSFQFSNLGDLAISGVVPISFYNKNPLRAGAVKLNTINVSLTNFGKDEIFTVTNASVSGNGSDSLYIVLNDAGTSLPTPITLPNTPYVECDYDNIFMARVIPIPAPIGAEVLQHVIVCAGAPNNSGAVRAYVPTSGGGQNTADYNFYWSDGNAAKPIPADFLGSVYNQLPANFYTVYARHKTVNCGSDTATVEVQQVPSAISARIIIEQGNGDCKNPNGRLRVVVNDTDMDGVGDPVGDFKYMWWKGNVPFTGDTISISHIATGLDGSEYVVYVEEKTTGCSFIISETVPDLTPNVVVTASATQITCSATNAASASADVGGTTAGYTFQWFDGSNEKPTPDETGSTYTPIGAGFYTVKAIHNASKCESAPVTVQVTQTTPPVVSISGIQHQTSCDASQPNGSATANITGASPATFEWFNGQNTIAPAFATTASALTSTVTGLKDGIYTVKVTDNATQCFVTQEVTINFAVVTPSLILGAVADITNCTTPNGSVTVNVTLDTNADYTFSWYNGTTVDGTPDYTDTDNVLSNLPPGDYTVQAVHNTKNCITAPITATVGENTPVISIVQNAAVLKFATECNANTGAMEVQVSAPGNTLGFRIEWFFNGSPTPFKVTPNATVSKDTTLFAGSYLIRATNLQNGCFDDEVFNLPYANGPDLSLVDLDPVITCDPQNEGAMTVRLEATAGFTVSDYEVRFYAGKNSSGTLLLTIPGSGGSMNGDGSANFALSTLPTGFYTAVAFETNPLLNNCASVPVTVEVISVATPPVFTAGASVNNVNCNGVSGSGSISLNIANPNDFDFFWFEGTSITAPVLGTNVTGASEGGVNGEVAQNLRGGFYTVRVVKKLGLGANSGCDTVATYQIFDNLPTITLVTPGMTVNDVTMCVMPPNGSAVVNTVRENGVDVPVVGMPTPNYTFEWFTAGPTPIAGNATNTLPNVGPGIYFVRATNTSSNCSNGTLVQFEIEDKTINSVAVALTNFVEPTRCLKPGDLTGELIVAPSGSSTTGYTVEWFDGTTATGPVIFTGTNFTGITIALGQPDITYTVRARNNDNQCTVIDTYTLEIDNRPVNMTASASPVTLCNANDGTLSAIVTSGASDDYDYLWSIGNTIQVPEDFTGNFVSGRPTGFYTVQAVDQLDNFCRSADITVEITNERVMPVLTTTATEPLSNCDPVKPNGVANASVNGDLANYEYDWYLAAPPFGAPYANGVEINNLQAGTYAVIATHILTGCADTTAVTIEQRFLTTPMPQVEVVSNVTSCVGVNNGILSASVNGNTMDYIFHWYNANPGNPPDTTGRVQGEYYRDLAVGTYYASATSRITGCISAPVPGVIILDEKYPDFEFKIQPASCQQSNGFVSLFLTTPNIDIASIVWEDNSGNPLVLGSGPVTGPILTGAPANAPGEAYYATVTSSMGCATRKPVIIKTEILPYNGVSRNGDSKNDFFWINCIENFVNNHVQIFNRAGTLVYEADGYDNIDVYFDGKANKGITLMGNNLPDGTYFYIIDKRDGSRPVAGYLEIVN